MGVTIHYRGTIDSLDSVTEMEDRVIDLVFALGGQATVWRSHADHDPTRMIRGLMIEMAPGQESLSLLLSPEGVLTPICQIESAEQHPFEELPSCFVKTQFGSVLGHVAIVHLLDALRREFFSDMQVSDEGGYFENRSIPALHEKMLRMREAIDSLAQGLQEYGLSEEAAEDPQILAARIERVARLVQQKICEHNDTAKEACDRPEDHLPAESSHQWQELSLEEEVEVMDQLRRRNELRGQRMSRRISEATAGGLSHEQALEMAMREEGIPVPSAEDNELDDDHLASSFDEDQREHPESWAAEFSTEDWDVADVPRNRERHPAVVQAQDFVETLLALEKDIPKFGSFHDGAYAAALEIVGGLVQATHEIEHDRIKRALSITQLKRALKGHGFARGAVFAMHSAQQIDQPTSQQLHEQLEAVLRSIHQLMAEAWNDPEFS